MIPSSVRNLFCGLHREFSEWSFLQERPPRSCIDAFLNFGRKQTCAVMSRFVRNAISRLAVAPGRRHGHPHNTLIIKYHLFSVWILGIFLASNPHQITQLSVNQPIPKSDVAPSRHLSLESEKQTYGISENASRLVLRRLLRRWVWQIIVSAFSTRNARPRRRDKPRPHPSVLPYESGQC